MNEMDVAKYRDILENRIKILRSCDVDLSVDEDGDEIDLAQSSFLSSMAYIQRDRNNSNIELLNSALEKIHNNIYGECEECGEDIGKRRLDVFPEAQYCIKCAEEMEKERKNFR